ncbi:MAG: GNAT family N-acetyltransferase [Bacilli bacterium]|nr:GNAT family N-acetyltransferase [Bacilli bacterium]
MIVTSIKNLSISKLKGFDCGDESLNHFLYYYASQNDRNNLGKTFVALDGNQIIGFYTLSNSSLAFSELSSEDKKKLPRYPIPCIRIARFAVDVQCQKQGVGKQLLSHALKKIVSVSEHSAIYFVIVEAKDNSRGFYEHYGFHCIDESSLRYTLPLKTIKKAIAN